MAPKQVTLGYVESGQQTLGCIAPLRLVQHLPSIADAIEMGSKFFDNPNAQKPQPQQTKLAFHDDEEKSKAGTPNHSASNHASAKEHRNKEQKPLTRKKEKNGGLSPSLDQKLELQPHDVKPEDKVPPTTNQQDAGTLIGLQSTASPATNIY